MLSITSTWPPYNLSSITIESCIVDYCKADSSPAVAQKCRSALLKEFRANMDRVKPNDQPIDDAIGAMGWLLGIIQHCDKKMFEKYNEWLGALEWGMIDLAESLPLVD